MPPDRIRLTEEVPGGWYWHGRLAAGEVLRIANPHGTEGVALLLWNAADPSERLNPADTIKVQWTARIGKGRVLLSDMGRAMASVIDATDAPVDCLLGGSTPASNRRYGDGAPFNARDHFLKVAGKNGLGKRDVGPSISLFAPVVADADGGLAWDGSQAVTGRIDLRAEMALVAAVANCPHPLSLSAAFAPKPISLTVWRGEAPAATDLCRTATPEAGRAFDNTAAARA